MNVINPTQSVSSSVVNGQKAELVPRELLLDILIAIRGSSLPTENKTAIRDVVLEYAKDENASQEKGKEILELLENHEQEFSAVLNKIRGKKPIVSKVSTDTSNSSPVVNTAQSTKSKFGNVRPQPKFGVSAINTVQSSSVTTSEPESETIPSTSAVVNTQEPVMDHQPVVNEVPQEPHNSYSAKEPLERIREIKHNINEKVGNPVNLVDVDNEVGREYMAALLDAMKKATGGTGGIDAAMSRLEAAYQSAIVTLAEHDKNPDEQNDVNNIKEEKAEVPAKVPHTVEASEQVGQEKTDLRQVAQAEAPSNLPTVDNPPKVEPSNGGNSVPIRKVEIPKPEPVDVDSKLPVENTAPTPSAQEMSVASNPETRTSSPVSSGHSLRSLAHSEVDNKKQPTAHEAPQTPVASPVPTPEPKKENVADQPATSTAKPMAPKNTEQDEVQAGLEQLLSEWKLFKGSGFLGMGPGGKNHPLYKKLANISMSSIVSGRFEGATPEVKRSIMDYIKGWRYEHDVTHDINETFEQYLTRVIQHILEKTKAQKERQKKSSES